MFAASIGPVAADNFTMAYYAPTINMNLGFGNIHPSTNATMSASGQCFTPLQSGYLTLVRVKTPSGGTNGTAIMRIYAITGSYGTTGVPTGSALASSEEVHIALVGDDYFNFDGTLYLSVGTNYAFAIECQAFDGTPDNILFSGTSAGAYGGNAFHYDTSAWQQDAASTDYYFTVMGSDTPGATSAPLPTGGLNVDTSDADAVMEALIGYGVPVVVMLLPTIFIWLIGGRGKWPMLIGISIGTGIGYLFGLVPVWLVFLISIGVVGFAYQSARSGN